MVAVLTKKLRVIRPVSSIFSQSEYMVYVATSAKKFATDRASIPLYLPQLKDVRLKVNTPRGQLSRPAIGAMPITRVRVIHPVVLPKFLSPLGVILLPPKN